MTDIAEFQRCQDGDRGALWRSDPAGVRAGSAGADGGPAATATIGAVLGRLSRLEEDGVERLPGIGSPPDPAIGSRVHAYGATASLANRIKEFRNRIAQLIYSTARLRRQPRPGRLAPARQTSNWRVVRTILPATLQFEEGRTSMALGAAVPAVALAQGLVDGGGRGVDARIHTLGQPPRTRLRG
jgi:hypothetical protein